MSRKAEQVFVEANPSLALKNQELPELTTHRRFRLGIYQERCPPPMPISIKLKFALLAFTLVASAQAQAESYSGVVVHNAERIRLHR